MYASHCTEAEAVSETVRALGRRALLLEGDLADLAIPSHLVAQNTIAPALIAGTRMLPTDPAHPDALPAPIPVGRLGTVDDIAAMALAMLANGYLTNKVITVDGGLYPA